jgi:hypothetical protein
VTALRQPGEAARPQVKTIRAGVETLFTTGSRPAHSARWKEVPMDDTALDVTAVVDRDWPADLAGTDLTGTDLAGTCLADTDLADLLELLAGRVPISLIMDLAMPAGPHSRELLEAEGSPDVAWWEPR